MAKDELNSKDEISKVKINISKKLDVVLYKSPGLTGTVPEFHLLSRV